MTGDLISPESEEFGALFRSFAHSVFRLETLQVYRGQRDLNLLSQFLEGKPRPPDPAKALWTAMITSNVQEGKAVQRVHVTIEPLTDYLRFELTWGPTNPNAPASRLACGTCGRDGVVGQPLRRRADQMAAVAGVPVGNGIPPRTTFALG